MTLLHKGKPLGVVLAICVIASPVAAQQDASVRSYSLQEAIQEALANSHTIAAAEEGIGVADQQVREAWAAVLPDLTANASYARNLQV